MADEQLTAEQIWKEELTGEHAEPVSTPSPEATPQDEPVTPVTEDPVNEADDVLARLENRLRRVEGQYGGINSTLGQMRREITEGLKTVVDKTTAKEQPTAQQIADASVSGPKWNALKEDFPDWADAIEERLGGIKPPEPAATIDIEALRAEFRAELQQELSSRDKQAEVRYVTRVHPNWRDEVASTEFQAWKSAQPPDIQALAASDSADDAISMLDRWEAHKKAQKRRAADTRDALREGANLPSGGNTPIMSKTVEEMTPQEYWRYLAKQTA